MEYKYTQETVDWLKQQMATEKKRRVYYQHIVYSVCNMLDQIDGRHPGNCIVCGTAEEQYNDVEEKIQQLTTELDSLRHQLSAAQEREAIYTEYKCKLEAIVTWLAHHERGAFAHDLWDILYE